MRSKPSRLTASTASLVIVLTGSLGLAACLDSANNQFGINGDDDSSSEGGSAGSGNGSGAGTTSGGQVAGDIPCDVAAVLAQNCVTCHGDTNPKGDVSLTSWAALTAPSPDFPGETVAQRSATRMRDAADPMPQAGLLADADIQVVEAWVAAGTPKGDCNGVGGAPPSDPVCTSGTYWSGGCHESKNMYPGETCVSCHQNPGAQHSDCNEDDGPALSFGGTVYSGLHELDDCNATGVSGTLVVVTDANGVEHQATVQSSGNFYVRGPALAMPITAEVRRNGSVIKMKDPVDSADCNSCHSVTGTDGAEGRIFAPN